MSFLVFAVTTEYPESHRFFTWETGGSGRDVIRVLTCDGDINKTIVYRLNKLC